MGTDLPPDAPIELDPEPLPEEDAAPLAEEEMDAPNLVPLLMRTEKGKRALGKIADQVFDEVEGGREGREEYCERVAKNWTLFTGHLKQKSFPFANCANLHVPVAIENAVRIWAHVSEEIFGDWSNVFGVSPMGPDDDLEAQILSVHGNWQIRSQIPGFKRQQDRGLLQFFYNGDITCHSYWDPTTRLNAHEFLNPDEFVTPYSYVTVRSDYGDLPWYARVVFKYEHEVEALRDTWYDVDKVLDGKAASWDDDPEQKMTRVMGELNRIHIPDADERAPYKFYWYEGFLKLPGQKGQRFCKVIIDSVSKAVMQLAILEIDNWQDKALYEQQMTELQNFQTQQQAHQEEMASRQAQVTALEQQHHQAQDMQDMAAQQALVAQLHQLGSVPLPPPPTPPSWLLEGQQPERPKKEPFRLFSHGVCIEPLAGNIGIGYGGMWADYGRAANTSLNHFVDAATLANVKSFIAGPGLEFKGEFGIKPGGVAHVANMPGTSVRDSLVPLEFAPANAQLVEVVDKIRGYAQQASQSPDVLSGSPGKSGEPYQALAARVELATKPLSAHARRYTSGILDQILKNNAALNAIFMRPEELFNVSNQALQGYAGIQQGENGQTNLTIKRSLYERSYQIEYRCDLRFSSMAQRVEEAKAIIKMGMEHPFLVPNQQFQYYGLKKLFEAMGRSDLVGTLGPPPPPYVPPPPPAPGMPATPPAGAKPNGAPPPPGGPPPPARIPQAPAGPPPSQQPS